MKTCKNESNWNGQTEITNLEGEPGWLSLLRVWPQLESWAQGPCSRGVVRGGRGSGSPLPLCHACSLKWTNKFLNNNNNSKSSPVSQVHNQCTPGQWISGRGPQHPGDPWLVQLPPSSKHLTRRPRWCLNPSPPDPQEHTVTFPRGYMRYDVTARWATEAVVECSSVS